MFLKSIISALSLASMATAHFSIEYPEMRGDSFAEGASQYIWPCANVNHTAKTNRTLWPLDGGSVSLDLHHPWTYVFINLGLGNDSPTFNISLTPDLLNVTGNGTYCLPKVSLPAGITPPDGQNASIMVATGGKNGVALYNCADITFASNATILTGDACQNSSNVVGTIVTAASDTSPTTNTTNTTGESSTPKSAGISHSSSMMTTGGFAGLVAVIISYLM